MVRQRGALVGELANRINTANEGGLKSVQLAMAIVRLAVCVLNGACTRWVLLMR